MGLNNKTLNLLSSNWFGLICVFVSFVGAVFVGFYLSGVVYFGCYVLCLLLMIVGCITLAKSSHKRIIEKYKRETGLSVFYLCVFNVFILASVLSVLLNLMTGDYLRGVAVIRLSSFCFALTGAYGLTKRSIYFDAGMITASCFFAFAILVFGNGINGN